MQKHDNPTQNQQAISVLSIAGLDNSGGAGLVVDCQVVRSLGCHPVTALTCSSAQCDQGVHHVQPTAVEHLELQLDCALNHFSIAAIKVGLLPNASVIHAVAAFLQHQQGLPIVLDPVLTATAGGFGLDEAALAALRDVLLPLVSVLTPNSIEAGKMLGTMPPNSQRETIEAANALRALGPDMVLLTGGHGPSDALVSDCLIDANGETWFEHKRLPGNVRGTGCALSAALAAALAIGADSRSAAKSAISFVQGYMRDSAPVGGQQHAQWQPGNAATK